MWIIFVGLLLSGACGDRPGDCEPGSLGCVCYADATCDSGLRCIGDEGAGEVLTCEAEEPEPDPCEEPTPNEEDYRAMDACETPTLCEETPVGTVSPCMLSALQERSVGRLHVMGGADSFVRDQHIWISMDGGALVIEVEYSYRGGCFETWGELRRCTIVDPEWFDTCQPGPYGSCENPDEWFFECEPAEPTCG
jgi:hypothetical protein